MAAAERTPDAFRRRAVQVEQEFLAAVEAGLSTLRHHRLIAGTLFPEPERRDSSEAVHAAMVDRRMFGSQVKNSVPRGGIIVQRGFVRRLLVWRRPASVTIATVLSPPGPLLDGSPPAPVTLAELTEHVRSVVAGAAMRAPALVVVCSPGGFAPEVGRVPLDMPGVKVVLVEPRPDGGWRSAALSRSVDERLVRMFDPEGTAEKFRRIRREIDENALDLLVGGLSAGRLAERLGLPARLVDQAFEMRCREDPELRVSRRTGETVLFRGAPMATAREAGGMSLTDRIRSLFSGKGDETRKINLLIERRTALAQRRDRVYEDVARLEQREAALMDEGRRNESTVARRRIAAQVAQVRRELARWNTTASMLNQQINVISTDVHNLTLLQQGQIAQLPSAEELTEHAVAAEEMLESLAADAKLVDGLEAGLAQVATTDDEAAILREFEAADRSRRAESPVADAPAAKSAAPAEPAAREKAAREPGPSPAAQPQTDRPQAEA